MNFFRLSSCRPSPAFFIIILWATLCWGGRSPSLYAQDPLYLINEETTVRKISFKFRGDPAIEADLLLEQIVTKAPLFWNRFDRFNPFRRSRTYPFDPIEFQKDVVRLREYYKRNGFPTPRITYSASQLNTESNTIHLILAINEGDPLFLRKINFLDRDSTTIQVPPELQHRWNRFTRSFDRSINARFTEVEQLRIQDQLYAWFQNQGYAFVQVTAVPHIDLEARSAELDLLIEPGPLGYVSSIDLDGNQLVTDRILLRELPFEVGDRYSSKELREGQQELFGLNLFRVALADLPPQLQDSSVDIRIRVTEAKPRYITLETGYSRQEGVGFEGEWLNRNFFGSARNLSVNFVANTGILASTGGVNADNAVGKLPARLFRTTVSIQQPYLFSNKVSGIFSPFIEFQNDPQLAASNDFLDINRREFGLSGTLIYELLPFRPLSLQYTLSRLLSRSDGSQTLSSLARDLYSKSIISFSANFGKANSYISPTEGFLIRPFIENAGLFITSGLQYNKFGVEIVNYSNITRRLNLSSRLFYGELWTFGDSREALDGRSCSLSSTTTASSASTEQCLVYENRFDPVFFYAGGGSDVRGWSFQLLGPKIARADSTNDENNNLVFENFVYERIGGSTKLIGNFEFRRRIPGFGPDWQGALFFDVGQISNGSIKLKDFHYAIGGGIRYNTFIGVIRADLALKLNPSTADLTDPEEAFLFERGLSTEPPREKFWRRFGLHLSIGQAF